MGLRKPKISLNALLNKSSESARVGLLLFLCPNTKKEILF